MKKIVYISFLFFVFCDNPKNNITEEGINKATKNFENLKNVAEIDFEKKEHDFGNVKAGERYEYSFKFKNKGKKPLILSNVQPSCGCTVSEYTKEPVNFGEEGYVKVFFTPSGKGIQQKGISVMSNSLITEDILNIKAKVK